MCEPVRFFLAGPSYVPPDVLAAQVRQPIAHRSATFRNVYERCAAGLQTVFRTERPVVCATSSATLLMEAAVASTVESRMLCLVNGAFSGRFATIGRALGKEVDEVRVPLGQAVDPELVRAALRRQRYDAVTLAHCETATGVLNPLAELSRAVAEEGEALVVADVVSSLAGAPVETDAWGIDVAVTASQKALALPPGLAFAAISERAEARIGKVSRRGWYTDLARYLEQHRDGGTISTAAATLYWALDLQLGRILAEGMPARWERHLAMRDAAVAWATERGLTLPAAAAHRSPTVTTIALADARSLVKRLGERGWTVASGYADWKETTFRIGHMGEVRRGDLAALLAEIDELLAHTG